MNIVSLFVIVSGLVPVQQRIVIICVIFKFGGTNLFHRYQVDLAVNQRNQHRILLTEGIMHTLRFDPAIA